jgi:ABC-type nitrate/sulfonate/bicarbonate transport system substrate-binding protein
MACDGRGSKPSYHRRKCAVVIGDQLQISRRTLIGLFGTGALTLPAFAADKIVAGTLGGQAPLWPFYIAAHKGFFAAQDLDVEINFAQSGAAVTQQLTGGSLDVALSVGINDPIHAIDKGAPLAIIRIIGNAAPYVLIGKPGLKTIADLKGRIVCIGSAYDMTTVYFDRMAAAAGLRKSDYQVVSEGVAAARYAALKAGIVDAAIVLPPINFQANKAGYVTIAFAPDYVKDLPFTAMAVLRPWAAAQKRLVQRLLAATDASIAWFADAAHRDEAVALLVQTAHANKDDAAASYDLLRRTGYFEPTSKVSRAKLHNVLDDERRAGNIGPALTIDRLVMPGITILTD